MSFLVLVVIASVVAIGGAVLAAALTAMLVLSRADILALADGSRADRSLQAISSDVKTHLNAATLACVACEVVAVVLVAIAVVSVTSQWWFTLICAGIGMTIGLFILIFSVGPSAGRNRARSTLRWTSIFVHALSVILGPAASRLIDLGKRMPSGGFGFAWGAIGGALVDHGR